MASAEFRFKNENGTKSFNNEKILKEQAFLAQIVPWRLGDLEPPPNTVRLVLKILTKSYIPPKVI